MNQPLDRYLAALRHELRLQLNGADVDRVVEEVESHLHAALADAATDADDIETVLAAFGSPDAVARAYRESGIRVIDRPTAGVAPQCPHAFGSPPSAATASRVRLTDLMNLKQTFRNLARHPGFAFVTIATLALGIGANAVILSVVNGILLQPLPYPDADRLIRVYHDAPGLGLDRDDLGLSTTTYHFFRDQGVLEDLAIYSPGAVSISSDDEPRRVDSVTVSHSFFDTLGVPPLLGRTFNEADEDPDAPEVVLLSESLWRNEFGARQDVLGETLIKDSQRTEIIGVMPNVTFPDPEVGIWEVMSLSRNPGGLGNLGTDSVARMPAGMTAAEAGAQLAARIANLTEAFPDEFAASILADAGFTAHAVGLKDNMVSGIERDLWLLLGSVGFVLLIVCANVANVFLVRAEGREREMAIRAAMGAGRGRLAAGFLIESAVLGIIAGTIGLALALAGIRGLLSIGVERLPRAEQIDIDGSVLAATLAISLFAGLLFGIIPTMRYNARWLATALKEGGRANTAGRPRFRMRSLLVAAQVALALVLLVGSGLMVRSYASLAAVETGFDTESMLTFRLMLNPNDYPGDEAPARFIHDVIDSIRTMPGVVGVAATSAPPLTSTISGSGFALEDKPLAAGEMPPVHVFKYVSVGYFETLGIPVVAGRTFELADHQQRRPAVIVNEAFARRHWPGEEAVGRRIQQGGAVAPDPNDWYRVVGVVGDVRGNDAPSSDRVGLLEGEPVPAVYYPLVPILYHDAEGNVTSPSWRVGAPAFLVRSSSNPTALVEPIRRRLRALDANLPMASVRTMEEILDEAMVRKSFTMMLLLIGASGALLIGAVGIYGVISYVVAQQTREIGVRMALGARREDIGRMVLGRSLWITGSGIAIGIAIGIAGAWYLTRFMASLLFGVNPLDPATFGAVIAMLLAVASVAAYVPARRATRIDPLEALRRD